VIEAVLRELAPIRERAAEYRARPETVRAIVAEGCSGAQAVARETLGEVYHAMGLAYG